MAKTLTMWWQALANGLLKTPQAIMAAVRAEKPLSDRFFSTPEDTLHFSAPARLAAASFILSTPHLKQWERADWQGVDPRIAYFAGKLQQRLRQMGIPTYVHTAYRTRAAQDAAFKAGNSKLQGDRTAHRVGGAVDLVHSLFHWDLSPQEWAFVGKVGKEVHRKIQQGLKAEDRWEIVWGGDWSFYDPAHWEIKTWKALPTVTETEPLRFTPKNLIDRFAP